MREFGWESGGPFETLRYQKTLASQAREMAQLVNYLSWNIEDLISILRTSYAYQIRASTQMTKFVVVVVVFNCSQTVHGPSSLKWVSKNSLHDVM